MRSLSVRRAVVAAATLLAGAPAAARASDGTTPRCLCFNPDTKVAAGLAPEVTNPNSHLALSGSRSTAIAAAVLSSSSGLVLANGSSGHFNDRQFGALRYDPSPGISMVSGQIWRSFRSPGNHVRFVVSQHGAEDHSDMYGLPRGETFYWYGTGAGDGNLVATAIATNPLAAINERPLTIGDRSRWVVTMACDTNGDGGCDLTSAGQLEYRLFAGKVVLADRSNPVPTGPATGELASAPLISGPADVTFGAVDAGAGVYRAVLVIDDQLRGTRVADANGGLCTDHNPNNADDYEFTVSQPCKLSGGGTVSFDTTGIPGGNHRLRVFVEDAAGNRSSLVDRTVAFEGVQAVRTANGSNASADVRIVATKQGSTARVVRVRFGRRVRVAGRLTNATGQPIGGATLDVLTQARFDGAPVRTAPKPVVTDARGRFTYLAPRGSSRTIRFAYRTNAEDADYAGTGDVELRVRAGVTLAVAPRLLRNGQTQRYSGRLLGPYTSGRFVDVEVKDGKRWKLVCSVRTRDRGRFACAHRFRRTVHRTRYVFRARVRRQAGLPYESGASPRRAGIVGS